MEPTIFVYQFVNLHTGEPFYSQLVQAVAIDGDAIEEETEVTIVSAGTQATPEAININIVKDISKLSLTGPTTILALDIIGSEPNEMTALLDWLSNVHGRNFSFKRMPVAE